MLYRAVKNFTPEIFPAVTTSVPGNVPFYVDNIWGWLRPDHFSSSTYSAFASSKPEVVASSAGLKYDQVYRVKLLDNQAVCGLVIDAHLEDTKYHADLGRLKRLVVRALLPYL